MQGFAFQGIIIQLLTPNGRTEQNATIGDTVWVHTIDFQRRQRLLITEPQRPFAGRLVYGMRLIQQTPFIRW